MVQVQAPNTWQPLKFKEEFQKTQLWSRKSQRDAFLTKKSQHTCMFVVKITTYWKWAWAILVDGNDWRVVRSLGERPGFSWDSLVRMPERGIAVYRIPGCHMTPPSPPTCR